MQTTATRATQHTSIREITQRKSLREGIWLTFVTFIVVLGSIFLLFPVAFMITTSLKTSGDAFLLPIKWLPGIQFAPHFENFATALNFMKWQRVFGNTLIVGVNSVVGTVISCSIVAYGFARFRAPGRNQIFMFVLMSLMIPYVSRLVPEYLAFAKLGMVDTLLPLMIPPWFGSAFNVFLLRQFFMTIPMEMDEAAKIDGAGPIRIFFNVLLPQIRPALAVVAIGDFTFNWNDFLRPLIYLNSPDKRTAAVALSFFQASYGGTPYNLLMAATLAMLIPVLILFFVAQRYFIQGIVVSGVKG
jgi:ABC-type glycerol-3-phosphate transport system permease component